MKHCLLILITINFLYSPQVLAFIQQSDIKKDDIVHNPIYKKSQPKHNRVKEIETTGLLLGFSEGNYLNEKIYSLGVNIRDENLLSKLAITVIDSDIETSTEWNFSLDYYFLPERLFTPYVGMGIGARYFEECSEYLLEPTYDIDCHVEGKLTVFPEAGLSIKLHDNIHLAINYRYHYHAFTSTEDFSSIGININTYF